MSKGAIVRLLIAVGLAAVLSGCTSDAPLEPGSAANSGRPTTPPTVSRPLDASGFAGDKVCDLLTDDQATGLGFSSSSPPKSRDGNWYVCTRLNSDRKPDDPGHVTYRLFLSTNRLHEIYRGDDKSYKEMAPLMISGQPAVRVTINDPDYCNVVVGLSETQSVDLAVSEFSGKACDLAVAVAEQIVHNLGG